MTDSPLAEACDVVLPICAGRELSVAATKTFIATAGALARLTAAWAGERALGEAIARLPERLTEAAALDWRAAVPAVASAGSLVTIGRGSTLAIAREAALKLKETCNRHAEAFSGAEFLHGPVSLVSSRYPILMFMPTDAAAPGMRQLADELRRMGTDLFVAEPGEAGGMRLPTLAPDQPEADAICLIQSFYAMAVRGGAAARHRRRPSAAPQQSHEHAMSQANGNGAHAVAASSVFDGVAVLPDSAVIIEGAHVVDVKPFAELPSSMPVQVLPGDAWLAPGFIDVQVNGGGDVLFNDTPTAAAVNAIAAAHRRYGTTGLLPTLISDTHDKMRAAIAAAKSAAAENPSVLGIHIEGPFLSPEKRGVHDAAMFRSPDAARHGSAHLVAGRRSSRDAGARARAGGVSSPSWCAAACASRSAIRWRHMPKPKRRSPTGSPASRISSMPCVRSAAAIRGPSPPRWNRPAPTSA